MKRYKYRKVIVVGGKKHDVRAHTLKELLDKINKLKSSDDKYYTVTKWYDVCFGQYKHLTPYNDYVQRNQIEKHIIPYIGTMRLSAVKPIDCQNIINHANGLSTYTIRRISQLLNFIFSTAEDNGLIDKNPARKITVPKGTKTKRRSLNEEEQQKVINVIKSDDKFLFFAVMLFCGLRNSEVADLRSDDIIYNVGQPYLNVRGTKSQNAKRVVPIPKWLVDRIQKTEGLIFTNQRGGKMSKESIEKMWNRVRKISGVDCCSYCLRHTYATNLMRAGVDIRVAQRIMGHSDIRLLADVYTHVDITDMAEITDKMAKIMAAK